MDPLHPPELERAWWRMVLLLTLLIALFALLRHASWPVRTTAVGPPAATVTAPVSTPAPVSSPLAKGLLFPLAGHQYALRDNFHEKRGLRTHKALDIMAPRGTPVRAVDDGRIARLYRGPMAGISVYQFDRGMGRVYFYAHLDRYADGLEVGRPVSRGDVIGFVGSTGNAPERAPHLHFAMHELGADKRWWRGTPVNPYELLRAAKD
jgi:murein DD-endopeptidase MepM/ murein hydrolase activator NlpD